MIQRFISYKIVNQIYIDWNFNLQELRSKMDTFNTSAKSVLIKNKF